VERQGSGGPSGLQNRQGVVARRLEGSIPSPLRVCVTLKWMDSLPEMATAKHTISEHEVVFLRESARH